MKRIDSPMFLIVSCMWLIVTLASCVSNGSSSGVRLRIPTGQDACLTLDGNIEKLRWGSDGAIVWEAPLDDRVLFSFPLPGGERFGNYGLGKFDLKIEGGPVVVMVFIERPGEKRRIYRPIDITIPREGWQTIHLDLKQPEIVRESHFKAETPRITFNLWAMNGGYPEDCKTRRISIRNVSLVKRYLDIRWNGVDYSSRTDNSGELVFEYPIVVANTDSKSRSVSARLENWEGRLVTGTIAPERVTLAPGDSASFIATLRLPADRAGALPTLYCEWFLPIFRVEGAPDGEETILRSSDHITLPIIIMPEHLENPIILFDRDGLEAMRERWRSTDWGKKEGDGWISQAENILKGDLTIPDGPGWVAAYYYCVEHRTPLRYEGPDKHRCPVGGEYRDVDFEGVDLDLDYRTNQHAAMFSAARTLALAFALNGDKRYSEGALTILRQYRDKYFTWPWLDLDASAETIDKGRVQFAKYMEAMYLLNLTEAFDILKGIGGVSEDEARNLERNFIIPISVEMTDYRMGAMHRQQAITKNALATGLSCKHAPLVAFATAGPVSALKIRRVIATSDGIPHEHGYTNDTIRSLQMAEMLYHAGIDTYDHMLQRQLHGLLWWNVPFNPQRFGSEFLLASKHYPDPVYRKYASRNLIEGEAPPLYGADIQLANPPSVNFPNSGVTILKRPWENGAMDAEFKWGIPDNRGSFSVLSLGLYFGGYNCQSYPGHFPWGSTDLHHLWQIQSASHSTIVVDRRNQSGMMDYFKDHYMPHPSRQLSFEDSDHAASTVVYNDRIYPGVKIWRAVSVLDGACLVLDLIRSQSEHTYDHWFHGVPDKSNGLAGIHLDMKPRAPFIGMDEAEKKIRGHSSGCGGYEMVANLSSATTMGDFGCDWIIKGTDKPLNLSMRVLNTSELEAVHGFEWSLQYTSPEKEFLLLSRKAKNVDFVVLFEPHRGKSTVSRFERFDVRGADGNQVAGALGVKVTISGRAYEVILNPDSEEVRTVKGATRKVLSVEVGK